MDGMFALAICDGREISLYARTSVCPRLAREIGRKPGVKLLRCGEKSFDYEFSRLVVNFGWHFGWLSFQRCLCAEMLGFDPNINGSVGSISEVLHFVLKGREPPGFSGLCEDFLGLAVFVGEAQMPRGENDDDASHVRVQIGFLMRTVVDVYNLNIFVLKC